MHDRAQFWSPVPDWSQVSLHAPCLDVVVVNPASMWLVSGHADRFLAQYGAAQTIGPRQICGSDDYALRVAPDRVMLVAGSSEVEPSAASSGCVATDVSDGMLVFDIHGESAAQLMAQGSEYPFDASTILPHESAIMQFAGLRLAVSRRPHGWRLHIERPWAPALWRWLQAHVEQTNR
jgi:sarcosine oxidase, subunit gamma